MTSTLSEGERDWIKYVKERLLQARRYPRDGSMYVTVVMMAGAADQIIKALDAHSE